MILTILAVACTPRLAVGSVLIFLVRLQDPDVHAKTSTLLVCRFL